VTFSATSVFGRPLTSEMPAQGEPRTSGAPVAAAMAGDLPGREIASTNEGAVLGACGELGVCSWLGVPYAAPPVGPLRWQPPHDAPTRRSVLTTRKYAPHCFVLGDAQASENCLYVNVWRPDTSATGLPVLFFIHGGGNLDGNGDSSPESNNWANTAREYGLVVVSLNYRLGPLGWFAHPALETGDPLTDSGNFGLLDAVKALKWVNANIAGFGGDPNNVTVAGQSTGAQDVAYLMHSPLAKDYFHKAIIQSSYPGIRPKSAAHKSSSQVLYNMLIKDGRVANSVAAKELVASWSPERTARYLRSKSARELTIAYSNDWFGTIGWGDFDRSDISRGDTFIAPPIVQAAEARPEFVYAIGDGYVLPDDLKFADFSQGRAYPKPTIIGATRNENNAWNAYWPFNFQEGKTLNAIVGEAVSGSNPDYGYLQGIYDQMTVGGGGSYLRRYRELTRVIDALHIHLGVTAPARNIAAAGVPVYVYRWDWGSTRGKQYKIPHEGAWKAFVGAPHSMELPFFYQAYAGPGGANVQSYWANDDNLTGRVSLMKAVRHYLGEFFRSPDGVLNQTDDRLVDWQRWGPRSERYLILDGDYKEADVTMRSRGVPPDARALYRRYRALDTAAARDFVAYYVLWSWHFNWYPQSIRGPFATNPGPNAVWP